MQISKKNQVVSKIKEVQLKVGTQDHDIQTKARLARKWLENGDKVKVVLRFRGREMSYKNLGFETVERFFNCIKDISEYSRKPSMDGRDIIGIIVGKKG